MAEALAALERALVHAEAAGDRVERAGASSQSLADDPLARARRRSATRSAAARS